MVFKLVSVASSLLSLGLFAEPSLVQATLCNPKADFRCGSPAGSTTRVGEDADVFQTPSGNIHCILGHTYASCVISSKTWSDPPRDPECEFDWGGGITLDGPNKPEMLCASDTFISNTDKVLAYGDSLSVGDVRCDSSMKGVRCTHVSGWGFSLARGSYEIKQYPDDECISLRDMCSGSQSCSDGSDRAFCPGGKAPQIACDFSCRDDKNSCLSAKLRCDGHFHCIDGSDEQGCTAKQCDPATEVRCDAGAKGPNHTIVAAGKSVMFQSPSKNIVCNLSSEGATCEIGAMTWTAPIRPAGSSCEFDYGPGMYVDHRTADFVCQSDTMLGQNVEQLAYGASIAAGTFRCDMMSIGVHCRDYATGRGFRMSRNAHSFEGFGHNLKSVLKERQCIPLVWVCDGTPDCRDGQDEQMHCKKAF